MAEIAPLVVGGDSCQPGPRRGLVGVCGARCGPARPSGLGCFSWPCAALSGAASSGDRGLAASLGLGEATVLPSTQPSPGQGPPP